MLWNDIRDLSCLSPHSTVSHEACSLNAIRDRSHSQSALLSLYSIFLELLLLIANVKIITVFSIITQISGFFWKRENLKTQWDWLIVFLGNTFVWLSYACPFRRNVWFPVSLCFLHPLLYYPEPLPLFKMLPASAQPLKGIWIGDPALLFPRWRHGAWRGELMADSVPHGSC